MARKIIYSKLAINVEQLPKQYFVKTKTGTYLNLDLKISLDDPKVWDNDNGKVLQFGSFSKPQTKEEREDSDIQTEYFKGMYLTVNAIGEYKKDGDDNYKWDGDDKWKQAMTALKGEVVKKEESGDLPF